MNLREHLGRFRLSISNIDKLIDDKVDTTYLFSDFIILSAIPFPEIAAIDYIGYSRWFEPFIITDNITRDDVPVYIVEFVVEENKFGNKFVRVISSTRV